MSEQATAVRPGGTEGYSERLLAHFREPRNTGELPDPDAVGLAENPASGATLELQLSVQDGRIRAARFRAEGCAATIAAGSALTELLQGRTPGEAEDLTRKDIEVALGGLPLTRKHAAALAIDAVRAALADLGRR